MNSPKKMGEYGMDEHDKTGAKDDRNGTMVEGEQPPSRRRENPNPNGGSKRANGEYNVQRGAAGLQYVTNDSGPSTINPYK